MLLAHSCAMGEEDVVGEEGRGKRQEARGKRGKREGWAFLGWRQIWFVTFVTEVSLNETCPENVFCIIREHDGNTTRTESSKLTVLSNPKGING